MQDKIQEIMGLVVQYGRATVALNNAKTNSDIAKELRKVDDIGVAVKDKLRELVREPLDEEAIERATGVKQGTPMFLAATGFVRATERAHNITSASGEV